MMCRDMPWFKARAVEVEVEVEIEFFIATQPVPSLFLLFISVDSISVVYRCTSGRASGIGGGCLAGWIRERIV